MKTYFSVLAALFVTSSALAIPVERMEINVWNHSTLGKFVTSKDETIMAANEETEDFLFALMPQGGEDAYRITYTCDVKASQLKHNHADLRMVYSIKNCTKN